MNPETHNNTVPPPYSEAPQGYVPQEGYAPQPQEGYAPQPQQGYVAPAYNPQPVAYTTQPVAYTTQPAYGQPTVAYAQPTVVIQQPAIVQTTYSNDDGKDDVMPSLLM